MEQYTTKTKKTANCKRIHLLQERAEKQVVPNVLLDTDRQVQILRYQFEFWDRFLQQWLQESASYHYQIFLTISSGPREKRQ